MAEISLSIGGRAYKLACRDGEEEDLRAAAGLLDSRVSALMQAHGAVAEPRLLLMAALLVSGELLERKSGEARITPISAGAVAAAAPSGPGPEELEALARRAEALARKLEEAANAA